MIIYSKEIVYLCQFSIIQGKNLVDIMLSNAAKYAIRAVLFLAINSKNDSKYGAIQIAKDLDIPQAFIAKLLQKLAKGNIISSSKGPTGGFYFTKENGGNNVCKIIELIDGKGVFDKCFMGLPNCGDAKPCPVHHLVAPFKKEILEQFLHKNINQLAQEVNEKGLFLSLK